MNWYIGCSGFHYKEWKGIFYPDKLPQSKWFEYYSRQFNTLELNVTFYRFPQHSFLQNWYKKSPEQFLFSVKAPRLITHYKQFNDTEKLLSDFYTTIRQGLMNKLGAVLFQLPPQAIFTEERLQKIIHSLDKSFNNVVEFRHQSWWKKEIIKELSGHKISFCGVSYPGLPDKAIVNTFTAYYRFHGLPVLYKSAYADQKLEQVAKTIKKHSLQNAFIYFNNTASAAALGNATSFRSFVQTN
jgi:uncharacterized protein YecE (DUF72 family)